MSERFPGGIISKTAPVPTGPYENGTAPGIWTLEQQAEFVKQGIWPIAGNVPNYIEDVFSTWLYTGNGSTQTITNGIDLAGKGGLTWFKERSGSTWGHALFSGIGGYLRSQSTDAVTSNSSVSNTSSGFTLNDGGARWNANGTTYASWTFREQPKFFDVVTYTGNGGASQTINHNLNAAPGCMIVKRTDQATNWEVYHRSLGATKFIWLNSTAAEQTSTARWNDTAPTSTQFTVGSSDNVNANGGTYVAYLFAHNAGGFGLTGTDNVISCGSYVGNSTTPPTINLGWEPQWILLKDATASGADARFNWTIVDNMRGLTAGQFSDQAQLFANTSGAEDTGTFAQVAGITATGFVAGGQRNTTGNTYIYIAIRRGPMKTPTSGTSVFKPVQYTTSPEGFITGFPVDFGIAGNAAGTDKWYFQSRLQGAVVLNSASTAAEVGSGSAKFDMMNGYGTGFTTAYWAEGFRRAPGFFDEVCYTGTGAATTRAHNLGVVPELMISKRRSGTAEDWYVYHAAMGAAYYMFLNLTNAKAGPNSGPWNSTAPTSSVFSTGDWYESGATYVTYLFASCPGVSKVGSFTGTGTTQTINCGFTGGARFVFIKATSTTGDWYVWDSARGIVAGNDPYLALNNTNAEVTNTDWVDTAASGFELSNNAGNLANSNGVSYIFLAVA